MKKKHTRLVSVPSTALLGETITALSDSFDRDLFAQTKEQLERDSRAAGYIAQHTAIQQARIANNGKEQQ